MKVDIRYYIIILLALITAKVIDFNNLDFLDIVIILLFIFVAILEFKQIRRDKK